MDDRSKTFWGLFLMMLQVIGLMWGTVLFGQGVLIGAAIVYAFSFTWSLFVLDGGK